MERLIRNLVFSRTDRRWIVALFALAAWALVASAGLAQQSSSVTYIPLTGDDGNGRIDRIRVSFSTPMNRAVLPQISSGAGVPGFSVDGYTITNIAWDETAAHIVNLTIAEGTALDTGALPVVRYRGPEGGALAAGSGFEASDAAVDSRDGAGPVLSAVYTRDRGPAGLFNINGDEAIFAFSEPAALTGASKTDRWENLERAIRFTNNGGGCGTDGIGVPNAFNFPQPDATKPQSADPIEAPAVNAYAREWRVVHKVGALQPNAPFAGAGDKCLVSIEPNATGLVTDAAGNVAKHRDNPTASAGNRAITPAETQLVSAKTIDGNADGVVDGVTLTFEQSMDDATVEAHLDAISVSSGGTSAVISGLGAGTANDPSVTLAIDTTATTWGTGVTPSVAYTMPSACTPTGGTGMKSFVPTPSARACVASFSAVAGDGAGPALLASTTGDTTADGFVDSVALRFSEAIAAPGSPAQWKLDGRTASAVAVDPADARRVTLTVPQGGIADSGTLPTIAYTPSAGNGMFDAAANQVAVTATPAGADGAAPRIAGASLYDLDDDGAVETLTIRYSEPVIDAGIVAGDFSVDGTSAAATTVATVDDPTPSADDALVTLRVASLSGTGARAIAFSPSAGSVADASGNASGAQTYAAAAVTDKAKALGTISVSPSAPIPAGLSTVTIRYTELMRTSITPTATLDGRSIAPVADANHTNGWRNDDAAVWDGTITIQPSDCAESTGCQVAIDVAGAQDLANNVAHDARRTTKIDTIAPSAPSPGAITVTGSEGDVFNMFASNVSVTAAVTAGEAEGGSAEILLDGAPLSTPAIDGTIGAGDTVVSPVTALVSPAQFQATFPEGERVLSVRLCDAAGNCSVSPGTSVTADYTPVPVEFTGDQPAEIVGAGDGVGLAWSAAEGGDLARVELAYSTDGGQTYPNLIDDAQPASGSYTWEVPAIDAAQASVAAISVDTAGNRAVAAVAEPFTIDSSAPVITLKRPTASSLFIPSGGDTTIEWAVQDATVDRVAEPVTIEYSTDLGATWQPINGGAYSKVDDGVETWRTPAVTGWRTYVRITAVDAVGRTTVKRSVRLAAGVGGYVADARGAVVAFGTAEPRVRASQYDYHWVHGMALRPDGTGGYRMTTYGTLSQFAIGDAPLPAKPSFRSIGKGNARAVALRPGYNDRGYVLDRYGRLHAFGGAPYARYTKLSSPRAVELIMLPDRKGGYVLDTYGRLYPFAIWKYPMPPTIQSRALWGSSYAVDAVLRSDLRGGWVLGRDGTLKPFGGAPAVTSSGRSSTAYAAALLPITDDGGYWVDGRGRLHRWGAAIGDPTLTQLGHRRARGAATS